MQITTQFGLRLSTLFLLAGSAVSAQSAEIGDKVFLDGNKNGLYNTGEPGMPGITITLTWAGGNGTFGDADDTTTTQDTDINGNFNFTGLAAGNYGVDLDNADLPAGLTVVAGSDPRTLNGVGAAQVVTTADFPLISSGLNLTLWTVNEADPAPGGLPGSGDGSPRLFCFTNYADTSGTSRFIDYGRLVWRDSGGVIQTFPGNDETNAESLAIDTRNGDAYLVVNPVTGGFTVPVLFKVNLYSLRPNAAQVELVYIGEVRDAVNAASTFIQGIAFDEPNNLIYAVNTETAAERLLEINPLTALWAPRGPIQGSVSGTSYELTTTDGLEVVPQFNGAGQVTGGVFYGYDQQDNHLYRINPVNGAILELTNTVTDNATDIETIAWDEQAGRMVAVDNGLYRFASLPLNGDPSLAFSTYAQQGLANSTNTNDLEGAGFFLRGVFPLGIIGNHIWNDANGNGQWDTGEAPATGVAVDLYFDGTNDGDFDDPGETTPYFSTTTNAQGFYEFGGLQAGRFQVRLPVSNYTAGQPLAAWNLSSLVTDTADNREDADDNGSQMAPGDEVVSPAIVLTEGEIDRTVDFGMLSADFGDALDTYPVLVADGGAWHPLTGPTLGATRDSESDGQAGAAATDDGADEDGVTLSAIQARTSLNFTANSSTAGALLDAWIDWNIDGDWDDAGEQIAASVVMAAGDNMIAVAAPETLTAGTSYARFRLSSAGGLSPGEGAADGEVEDYTIQLLGLGSISGYVMVDSDYNSSGDAPLPGVTLQLFTDPNGDGDPADGVPVDDPFVGGPQPYTVTSAADGLYEFLSLTAGNYVVVEVQPLGFRTISDADEDSDIPAVPGDAGNAAKDDRLAVSLAAEETDGQNNFLEAPIYARLGNRIWLDENSNGFQEPGERGFANVTVNIYSTSGALVSSTVTDENGGWAVTVVAGNYFADVVEATLPSGLTQSPLTLAGADFGNQDQATGAGDFGYPMTVSAGGENLTGDFGYNFNTPTGITGGTGDGVIGDRVWVDVNNNGRQDAREVGLEDVTLTLTQPGPDGLFGGLDDITSTTTTDALGYYRFEGLAPGAYTVTVTGGIPGGLGFDQRGDPDHFGVAAGVNDETTTVPIILAPGDVFLNADFGYQADSSNCIGDFVWLDRNADGSQGATEEGIAGVSVALIRDTDGDGIWDSGEPILAADVTTSTGFYAFHGMPDGKYLVWVNDTDNVLSRLEPTYDRDGLSSRHITAADIDSAHAQLETIDYTYDFGYTPAGHTTGAGLIGDYVWHDADRDGVQDIGERGIEHVLMGLYSAGGVFLGSTLTDENGAWWFGGLDAAATYTVGVESTNLLPGGPLSGMIGTWDADSGTSPDGASLLNLGAPGTDGNGDLDGLDNGVNAGQDFGFSPPPLTAGSIGNLVWLDQNANGVRDGVNGPDGIAGTDDDEPGIAGVTVALYHDLNGDGVLDPGEPLMGSTATSPAGIYLFTGVPTDDGGGDGRYLVRVTDEAHLLGGYWHSRGTAGSDNNSQAQPYSVILNSGGGSNFTADFGFYVAGATLGNRVFLDADWSHTQSTADTALPNVEVTLTITWPGGSMAVMKTVSEAAGFYSFGNLLLDENHRTGDGPGIDPNGPAIPDAPAQPQFLLSIAGGQGTLTGLIPTSPNSGSDDKLDSDSIAGVVANPVKGLTAVGALNPVTGESVVASFDFGFTTTKPDTWTAFLGANLLSGSDAEPEGNPDGDIYPNILEYAFCLPPRTGTPLTPNGDPAFCVLSNFLSGGYDVQYTAPVGLAGLTYRVQYAPELGSPTLWSDLIAYEGDSYVLDNENGTRTYVWEFVNSLPGMGTGKGFFRILVELDSDGDNSVDAIAGTYVMGWQDHGVVTQCETWSNPFLSKEPFSGTADAGSPAGSLDVTVSASGASIPSVLTGYTCLFAEITSGAFEGHRFAVNIPACDADTIALQAGHSFNTLSPIPDLSGAPFVLREPHTVWQQFPPRDFQSAGDPLQADNLLIFDHSTQSWRTLFLAQVPDIGIYWVDTADTTFPPVNQNDLCLNPGHGLYIHRRGSPLTLSLVGVVRENDYASPLAGGYTFVGGGYPMDQSYASRGMTIAAGFDGDPDIRMADQIYFWAGDNTPGHVCYLPMYLLDAGAPYQRWVDAGDNMVNPRDALADFISTRAAFYCRRAAFPGYVMPAPWLADPPP